MTGVLQGSVLSPHLYSVFINSLPDTLWCAEDQICMDDAAFAPPPSPLRINGVIINCLLYADDMVLISSPDRIPTLRQACDQRSVLHHIRTSVQIYAYMGQVYNNTSLWKIINDNHENSAEELYFDIIETAVQDRRLQHERENQLSQQNPVLLRACRPNLGLDTIFHIPMPRDTRRRCLFWRLGWLPNGRPWLRC